MSQPAAAPDEAKLDSWLAAHVPGWRGPLSLEKFDTGQSNPTYLVNSAGGLHVLRMKPPGVLLKSAHAVERE